MTIGFIGTGKMGAAMARNLARAGFAVKAWNRDRGKLEPLTVDGVTAAGTVSEAAQSDIVISMLADDHATEQVVCGEGGLLSSLPAGGIHLAMSTISAQLSQRLTKAHAEQGQDYVAAPVMGRPDAAAAAKLFILAGGPAATLDRCEPLFAAMGQRTFLLGDEPYLAHVVKLSMNFLIASTIESMGEAMALVRKAGLDANGYLDLLTSTLFTAPVHKTYGALLAEQRFTPPGFPARLGLKDIRLALQAGELLQVPLPVASLMRDHAIQLLAQGRGEEDWAALGSVAATNAGL